MSGFWASRARLRGPGSVPPRPGRWGCGAPFCAEAVVAAAAIPAAVAVIIFRREIFIRASPRIEPLLNRTNSTWQRQCLLRDRLRPGTATPAVREETQRMSNVACFEPTPSDVTRAEEVIPVSTGLAVPD